MWHHNCIMICILHQVLYNNNEIVHLLIPYLYMVPIFVAAGTKKMNFSLIKKDPNSLLVKIFYQ